MTDHKKTYSSEAMKYDSLISYEDYQGNLLPAIQEVNQLSGRNVLDLGAGTGRLTTMLAPFVNKITALDLSHPMLKHANEKMKKIETANLIAAADHRALPIKTASQDVIISGWSICYLADWFRDTWRKELETAFSEMKRVLQPDGKIIIIETQGTGFDTPHPPVHIADYFKYLNREGFEFKWIRTDYRFPDLETAVRITKFFFGDELADQVKTNNWVILPECTGIWWKTIF
jgi:ubiquinone/menaquinone biosynthesis C-methylase UbiE